MREARRCAKIGSISSVSSTLRPTMRVADGRPSREANRALDGRKYGRNSKLVQGRMVTKTVRITRALGATLTRRARAEKKDFSEVWREAVTRGLKESDGIDMAGALHGIIGKYAGSGESQPSRMSRYGRARHRS